MVLQNNLSVLQENYPFIYERIVSYIPDNSCCIEPTRTGDYTLKHISETNEIYVHSKYDPLKEASRFIESNDFNKGPIIVYGFGLGYHIKAMLPNLKEKVYIFELNPEVLYWAVHYVDLTEVFSHPLVELIWGWEINETLRYFQSLIIKDTARLISHRPSLEIIPEQYNDFKFTLSAFRLSEKSMKKYLPLMEENFRNNLFRGLPLVDYRLLDQFKDKTVFLAAAGPSLDKNAHHLARVGDNGKIIAVGTALKPLLAKGVVPNLVVISDPSPLVIKQIEGIAYSGKMMLLSTAFKGLADVFPGEKYIALQSGFEWAEELGHTNSLPLFETGGSVATLSLDFALRAHPRKIIIIGQDLAYTDGYYHASGTFHLERHRTVVERLKVPGYDGGLVETSLSLFSYLNWIERRIKSENVEILNATEGGAMIKGAINKRLQDVLVEMGL